MSQVKERPILFSAPMVRAILEDRKTVTRRAVKPQPEVRMVDMIGPMLTFKNKRGGHWLYPNAKAQIIADCPYGQPGDRLWVRETFMDLRGTGIEHRPTPDSPLQRYAYSADVAPGSFADETRKDYGLKWRPSIHLPREACRILLKITDVRVERLKDISDEQAQAEGCFFTDYGKKCFHGGNGWNDVGDCPAVVGHQQREGWMWDKTTSHEQCLGSARHAFGNFWNKVNGPDAWDSNPWVWVVEFKRVTP